MSLTVAPLFAPGIPGGPEMLVILLIAILLFGANKIPKLARSSGEAIGEFKKGREEVEKELQEIQNMDEPIESESDDEESFDERVEWFGWRAGIALTAILIGMLLVGPWRLFDVTFTGGGIPFELRDAAEMSITLVAPVVFVVVGAVTSLAYRVTTDDVDDDYRGDLAILIVVTQMLAALALFVLVMLVPIGQFMLDGELFGAIVLMGGTVIYLLLFTFYEIVAITLYVGIPTYIGTFLGGLVGSVLD